MPNSRNRNESESLETLIDQRLSRREILQNAGAIASLGFAVSAGLASSILDSEFSRNSPISFEEIEHGIDASHAKVK